MADQYPGRDRPQVLSFAHHAQKASEEVPVGHLHQSLGGILFHYSPRGDDARPHGAVGGRLWDISEKPVSTIEPVWSDSYHVI